MKDSAKFRQGSKHAKTPLRIVEIEKQDIKPKGTPKELTAAILSLQGHVGFDELLRRQRVARSILLSNLINDDQCDVVTTRALIKAYSFLERQLFIETGRKPAEEPRDAFDAELQAYLEVSKALEIVGRSD